MQKFHDIFMLCVGILESCSSDGVLLVGVKEQLWQYQLHTVMLTALKQDFNKILDGWNTAAKLSHILVLVVCCANNSLCWYCWRNSVVQ